VMWWRWRKTAWRERVIEGKAEKALEIIPADPSHLGEETKITSLLLYLPLLIFLPELFFLLIYPPPHTQDFTAFPETIIFWNGILWVVIVWVELCEKMKSFDVDCCLYF
jgi:hypothetical protein